MLCAAIDDFARTTAERFHGGATAPGLGLATAARLFPPSMRRAVLTLHRQTALAALASIVAHGVLLLPDHWLHPGAVGIAVPFAIGYRPVATGLGILAGYLAAVLGLSFYARRRMGRACGGDCTWLRSRSTAWQWPTC